MNTYKIGDVGINKDLIELGDKIELAKQTQEVVKCQETGVKMLNIDAKDLAPGDLKFIKNLGLTISNPDTDKPVALGVDYIEESFGDKLAKFFAVDTTDVDDTEDDDDSDNDSGFFSSGGSFGGGFSGGFGGFGGGSFGGAGASAGF